MEPKKPKRLIAFYSPAPQSGKTTASWLLQRYLGFESISFATPFKDMLWGLLNSANIPFRVITELETTAKETPIPILGGKSYRELAQTLGSQWGRNTISDNVWVDIATAKIKNFENVVIDDLRFPNEYQRVKELGGRVFKIVRYGVEPTNSHESEGSLNSFEFDGEISNNDSIAAFENNVFKTVLIST